MPSALVLCAAIQEVWSRFANVTSIHGLKFIQDKKGNLFTKLAWILVTLGGFIASNLLVETFWLRYKSNPTRLSVQSSHVPLNQLAIPALTLCQISRVDFTRVHMLIDKLILPQNVTRDMAFDFMGQSAGFIDNIDYNVEDLRQMDAILLANSLTTEMVAEYLHQPCAELLVRCRWEFELVPCEEIFEASMSYHGSCCIFSRFKSTNYPVLRGGLSVVLNPSVNSQTYSSTYSEGVKLLIHQRDMFPSDLSVEKMISHRSENILRISTTLTMCSKAVRDLAMEDRECLFMTERKLRFFPSYLENNCDVVCRMDKVIGFCGCLPYFFRYIAPDVATCNFTQVQCLVDNYFNIHESRLIQNEMCHCPSNCNALQFDAHTIRLPFQPNSFAIDPFYDNLNRSHMILHVIFGKQVYREMRRDLLTNIISLAAGLGGIYGLFIGMSVITFFEVVYFFTIELWTTYKRKKVTQQAIAKKKQQASVIAEVTTKMILMQQCRKTMR